MNDLIERQKAIDALDEQITQCDKALGSFDISMKDEYAVKVERASLCAYKEILEDLPPAQPEARAQMSSADLISRQETIDAVEESRRLNHHQDGKAACAHEYEHRHFLKILRDLPSAQPDIPDTNVGDTISRQAAIDALRRKAWVVIRTA